MSDIDSDLESNAIDFSASEDEWQPHESKRKQKPCFSSDDSETELDDDDFVETK